MPKPGPLPQTSQTLATGNSLQVDEFEKVPDRVGTTGAVYRLRFAAAKPASAARDGKYPARTGRGARGGAVLDALDADAVRRWSRTAVDLLEAHRQEIDALNVYPVPDSDTGSNLVTTMRAADAALQAVTADSAAAALAALAAGAAHGALGNSGFIVSQILRGFADSTQHDLDARAVPAGLDRGAALARTAVVVPVEGTILTVARAAADAAAGATLGDIVVNALTAADAALQRTPSQLADLAEAGVVDAGGRGLVVLLDALVRTVTGQHLPLAPVQMPLHPPAEQSGPAGSTGFGFEVQYLLEAPAAQIATLRDTLAGIGDSVAVVPLDDEQWKVHAHVDDVGAAIEAGVAAGRPRHISVVRFADQIGIAHPHNHPDEHHHHGNAAIVMVAPGRGFAHLFEAEGAQVVEAPDGGPPTLDDLVATLSGPGGHELVLLSDAGRAAAVAEAAAEQLRSQGRRVAVVPTRSPMQGLAAIAVHDASRRFDDDVVAMAEAAAATRHAEVTIAAAEALTAVGICTPGDILGMIDGEVVEIGRGLLAVSFNVLDRLLGVGAELITVVVGEDAPARAGDLIEAHVRTRAPLTDVAVYQGRVTDHPVIIGVE
jgi:DAK2 domain fusion protein YloV